MHPCSYVTLEAMRAYPAAMASVTPGPAGPHGATRAFISDGNTPLRPEPGRHDHRDAPSSRADGTSLFTETVRFLQQGGVGIGCDSDGHHITGTSHMADTRFTVAGDRIEAASTSTESATTRSRRAAAADITLTSHSQDSLTAEVGTLDAVQAVTGPHPGLPTDIATQLAAMLTLARGTSVIQDRVYPRRDTHVQALRDFGADISADGPLFASRARLRAATPPFLRWRRWYDSRRAGGQVEACVCGQTTTARAAR
jgi:UDP-N-acetylglucosamine 1-carboxyvinyltransferase